MKIFALLSEHGVRFGLSVAIMILMLLNANGVLNLSAINKLENFAYDMRLNMLMPRTVDDRIVIIDVDEKSLKALGRWPWSRNKLASLVDKLFDDYQVKVLGFDMVFAEKDESSGLKSLDEIKTHYLTNNQALGQALSVEVDKLRPTLDYDQMFANSLKGRNTVLGYVFTRDINSQSSGILPPASFSESSFKGKNIAFMQAAGFGANLDILQNNAKSAGHFSINPDADGIMRRVPLLIQYDGNIYQSLPLAVAGVALEVDNIKAGFAGLGVNEKYSGLEWLKLGSHRVPVDGNVSALIPYRGAEGSFPYVSAVDVFNNKVNPAILKNKIVLLGTTAAGLLDLRATPVQTVYPGVEVQANMIAGILDNNIKEQPEYTNGAEMFLLFMVGLLLAFMLPVYSPLKATVLTLVTTVAVLLLNLSLWQYANLVLPLASLLVMIAAIYFVNMSYGFFVESRGKRQLAGLFGQYVPPELVDEMAKDPESFNLEGESREMTVLFSDIRGFTNIAEDLDPKQLTQLMNEFLTPMTQVIHHNRGTIDKYMGDAIMAFWGAPLADPNHAKHALQAAISMIDALATLQQDFVKKGWPLINIGVGLNTGLMTVGNMGSSFRMAYTVMGDAVNLGSRLESLTKNYGVAIIVSEFTKAQVPDFMYRELDIVRVKGKDKPAAIFEPIGEVTQCNQATIDNLKQYHEALMHYRNQQWGLAEAQLMELQTLEPQRYVYTMYLKRIAHFKQNPPASDWDGVFNYESK
ncbi:MAG: adenylate/guanylate cyclase domain-containing protein [Methylotenera sp.]|nr:adenylate/guanylate cyclase domain-containing protein [Methylotenera sp.]